MLMQLMEVVLKKLIFIVALFFICSIGLLAQGKQDFTIVNKTGVIIDQLHITQNDSDEWGEDILGQDVLDLEQECDITFNSKEDVCMWDFRVTDSDGNALEWEKIDLCKAVKITLFYKDGKGWAEIE